MLLFEILSELVKIEDILLVVRSNGAVSEIRSSSLAVRKTDRWITVGHNDGPAHMHVDSEKIKSARFIIEEKPERTSYSVRFFDGQDERVLAAFFTKMYDGQNVDTHRKKIYEELLSKFGSRIDF